MSDFTTNWHWPQWAIIFFMLIGYGVAAVRHGQEKLETSGEHKGKPQRYNAFIATSRTAIWIAVLICGGFFR